MADQKIEFSFPMGYEELRINGKQYGEAGNSFTLEFGKGERAELEFTFSQLLQD